MRSDVYNLNHIFSENSSVYAGSRARYYKKCQEQPWRADIVSKKIAVCFTEQKKLFQCNRSLEGVKDMDTLVILFSRISQLVFGFGKATYIYSASALPFNFCTL